MLSLDACLAAWVPICDSDPPVYSAGYCVIALLVVLFALVAIQGESMSDWLIQQFKH